MNRIEARYENRNVAEFRCVARSVRIGMNCLWKNILTKSFFAWRVTYRLRNNGVALFQSRQIIEWQVMILYFFLIESVIDLHSIVDISYYSHWLDWKMKQNRTLVLFVWLNQYSHDSDRFQCLWAKNRNSMEILDDEINAQHWHTNVTFHVRGTESIYPWERQISNDWLFHWTSKKNYSFNLMP